MARLLADAQDKNANEILEQLAVLLGLLCLRVVVVVSLTTKGGGSRACRAGGFANVHLRFPEGERGGQRGRLGKREFLLTCDPCLSSRRITVPASSVPSDSTSL